jgi:putative transposase
MGKTAATYKHHRYPFEIVARAVWFYFRFNLRLLERRIVVSETIRRWCRKHGHDYARRWRRKAALKDDVRHLDDLVVRVNGQKCRLWRAVDQDGYVLNEIVQTRRNTKAARRMLTRQLRKQGCAPKRMVTNRLRSYGAAKRQVVPPHSNHSAAQIRNHRLNARAESHASLFQTT